MSPAEYLKKYGTLTDKALSESVIVTRNDRDRCVLVLADASRRMTRYAPRARLIEELTDAELIMIGEWRVPAEYDHLNVMLDD